MTLKTLSFERAKWGPGPWQDEPDLWEEPPPPSPEEEPSAYRAWAARKPAGNWCGYVDLPNDHPWVGVAFQDLEEEVPCHGGLSHGGRWRPGDPWSVGFDCAHGCDLVPATEAHLREAGCATHAAIVAAGGEPDYAYRDLAFVKANCFVIRACAMRAAGLTPVGENLGRNDMCCFDCEIGVGHVGYGVAVRSPGRPEKGDPAEVVRCDECHAKRMLEDGIDVRPAGLKKWYEE